MRLKEKIVIDFEEFFTSGKFDFIQLGKTKEWITHNFPDPDGFDEHPEIFNEDIWTFGNIEFHFNKDELFLIYSDCINELDGGDSLELKKWFLEETEKLKLSEVLSQLNAKHIDFCKKTNSTLPTTVHLELQSGVDLAFSLEERPEENYSDFIERGKSTSQDEFMLVSFSFMRK